MPDWIGDQMAGVGPEATRGLRPECANSGRSQTSGRTGQLDPRAALQHRPCEQAGCARKRSSAEGVGRPPTVFRSFGRVARNLRRNLQERRSTTVILWLAAPRRRDLEG
jgi:hypothetical protein